MVSSVPYLRDRRSAAAPSPINNSIPEAGSGTTLRIPSFWIQESAGAVPFTWIVFVTVIWK
jgi:hypothetical protein